MKWKWIDEVEFLQMRSRSGASSALGAERAERERERAALLRHARDEAERSLQLAAALSARDTQLRHAREQLFEVWIMIGNIRAR